jgi:hypothetical protein
MRAKIANERLATVKALRRATYRPIEKARSMKAAEVDIEQYFPEFSHARAIARDECSVKLRYRHPS